MFSARAATRPNAGIVQPVLAAGVKYTMLAKSVAVADLTTLK